MNWLLNLWLAFKRERNRRRRWAYRNRVTYTWPNDYRRWQDKFQSDERRARQS